jgi:hypothetical protein
MISYHAYKLIHLIGVFLLLISLGGQLVRTDSLAWRKYLKVSHGIGLLLILIAGFGLLARLEMAWPWPLWIYLKILVWIVLGLMPMWLRRVPSFGMIFWWAVLGLASFSAYLANFKPFV